MSVFIQRLSLILLLCSYGTLAATEPVNVVYIPPGENGYWGQTTIALPAVAKQLGIKLTIEARKDLEDSYIRRVKTVLQTYGDSLDWVIWSQRRTDPTPIFELFESYGVKHIDITSGFLRFDEQKFASSISLYPHWKAQVINDEFGAGYGIAEQLVATRQSVFPGQNVNMVAIAGDRLTRAAQQTVNGLNRYFETHTKNHLIQLVYAKWQRSIAEEMAEKLIHRHGKVDAFWSANTNISFGITDHIRKAGYSDSRKPIVAGFGWNDEIFRLIKQRELAFSMGGNHLTAMWSLVVIYDHQQGMPLSKDESRIISVPLIKATLQNIETVAPFLQAKPWETVDIKQFSKSFLPNGAAYNFDLTELINSKQSH